MKFYDREEEIAILKANEARANECAQFTYLMGRRRIGKTALLREAYSQSEMVYFFVGQKQEALLCQEYAFEVERVLGIKPGQHTSFATLFEFLIQFSQGRRFTLAIDEFQTFLQIRPSLFGEMQDIWDRHKDKSRINLVCCGSMYRLMKKIFEDRSEPLYGRATSRLLLRPFRIGTIKEILKDYNPSYTSEDLLTLYALTGGVAKYIELLMTRGKLTHQAMLEDVVAADSYFLTEGQDMLIEEFGRDHSTYFSILSLIAQGHTTRAAIESALETGVGGQLQKLEAWYGLIKRVAPVGAKSGGRNIRYSLADNFLDFWFRFVYKNRGAVEIGNRPYLLDAIKRDYSVYSGRVLEQYFRDKLAQSGLYSGIGQYWDRKGGNEIDIVATNYLEKRAVCHEVKRQASKISVRELENKCESLRQSLPGYVIECRGLSMEDM